METVNLRQGTPEWHAHRLNHWNASDAPAMMGVSPYKSRTELLHERFTGIAKEVDAATQRRFDDGHRAEALARTLAEKIVGDELYPVTGTLGNYSASFDGLSMDESIGFEHKLLGKRLADLVWISDAGFLPSDYLIQMEQQAMVSGCERILFMASSWDDAGNLIEERHCWYYPNPHLRQQIIAAWAQFELDLAEYQPREEAIKPVAETMIGLPALSINTSGSITIKSNLDIFGEKLDTFIKGLNLKPQTDQDFANSEAAVKILQNAQDALEAAEANALAQASDVDEMRRTVAAYAKTARDTRLMLEKVVKAEKENRRLAIVNTGREAYAKHIASIEADIKPIRMFIDQPDFAGAIKGCKTIKSIEDKVDGCLANSKISADAIARDVRAKMAWFGEYAKAHDFLFADIQQIIFKAEDDFQLVVKSRIDAHKAAEEKRLETEREKIRAEEEAKAKTATVAKQALEQVATTGTCAIEQSVQDGSVLQQVIPTQNIPDTGATVKLGQLSDRLGITLTADFLRSLGFEPAGRERSAVLYRDADFPRICQAIVVHVQRAQQAYMNQLKKAA